MSNAVQRSLAPRAPAILPAIPLCLALLLPLSFTQAEEDLPIEGGRPGLAEAEQANGFVVTALSLKEPRARLKEIRVDLGRGEEEVVPVEVLALKDLKAVKLELDGKLPDALRVRAEAEVDYEMIPGGSIDVPAGEFGRLWLRIPPAAQAAEGKCTVRVRAQEASIELPLHIKVWPVDFPAAHRLPFKAYSQTHVMGSGKYIDGTDKAMLPAMLDQLERLGCCQIETIFSLDPTKMLYGVKEKKSGKPLYDYLTEHAPLTAAHLPDLDFSAWDGYIAEYTKRGMRQFCPTAWWGDFGTRWMYLQPFAETAFGKKLDDKEDAWRVWGWLGRQVIAYLRTRGVTEFWMRIGDEPDASELPIWIETSKRWRAVGFKVWSESVQNLPRSTKWLTYQNPHTDGWMVGLSYIDDFLTRTRYRSQAVRRRAQVRPEKWGRYTNGGAKDTFVASGKACRPFGDTHWKYVEDVDIYADGKPLVVNRPSPWGNKKQDVGFHYADNIAVCLAGGKHPSQADIEIEYGVRRRTTNGAGEIAVALMQPDHVWYYQASGHSGHDSYMGNRPKCWYGALYDLTAHGQYCCYHWKKEKCTWRYKKGEPIRFTPAYEGLRDSVEDAAYYRYARHALRVPKARLDELIAPEGMPILKMIERTRQSNWWHAIDPATTHDGYNKAKRALLEMAAEHAAPPQ
ncbi:MAG: hypothetical protein JXR37_04725 [Kiritimatiellae bacterium]|nr:hypothetical protein [Kiritimatiellia bacterium]